MHQYQIFKKEFEQAVINAGRNIEDVNLIAVSKRKNLEDIKQVIELGHESFGENQMQEVEKKWLKIKNSYQKLKLHYIGSIQSRKTEAIFKSCDVIHSVDRIKVVKQIKQLEKECNEVKDYFLQINTGNEPQKSGVPLMQAEEFIDICIKKYDLNVVGLMCLPPLKESPKSHFDNLRILASNFNLNYLSMGMSEDFEIALKCGATHIRVGTKIFGARS